MVPGDFAARWTVICAQCGLSPFRQVSKCQAPGDPIARWGSERQVTHEFETRELEKNLRQVASSPGWPGGSFARWRQVAPTGCRQVGSKWPVVLSKDVHSYFIENNWFYKGICLVHPICPFLSWRIPGTPSGACLLHPICQFPPWRILPRPADSCRSLLLTGCGYIYIY